MSAHDIRDLHTLEECRAVVDLQIEVWGRDMETVPAGVLLVSAKRGGILVGSLDAAGLTGFVWSMPGWRDGRPTHWSHMLGVRPDARGGGLGETLKRAQRDRAMAQGVGLIEWTFDPLQAPNAHLNFTRLGAIASHYLVDAYGEMTGPLHRGTPTDRLIAEWWIDEPHVRRRLETGASPLTARAIDLGDVPVVIRPAGGGASWSEPGTEILDADARRVRVPVPAHFSRMQQDARELAMAWRLAVRRVFQSYFARGYRAVDFFIDRQSGSGEYLLARQDD